MYIDQAWTSKLLLRESTYTLLIFELRPGQFLSVGEILTSLSPTLDFPLLLQTKDEAWRGSDDSIYLTGNEHIANAAP